MSKPKIEKSKNMTGTIKEFFILWFIGLCKLTDGIFSLLCFGMAYINLTLWSCVLLARYRQKIGYK